MGIGKFLGSISPAYGAVTGEGAFGKVQEALGPAGGIVSQASRAKRDADALNRSHAEYQRYYSPKVKGTFRKGGDVSAAEAVHKHERNMHKGKPLTKFAKGGKASSASKRADGIATKGKTKGRFV